MGLLLVVIAAKLPGEFTGPMTSLGASALIFIALPQCPVAQPRSVLVGSTMSALVGITTFHFLDRVTLAISVAAWLSI